MFSKQAATWNIWGKPLLSLEIMSRQGHYKNISNGTLRHFSGRGPTSSLLIYCLLFQHFKKDQRIDCAACDWRSATFPWAWFMKRHWPIFSNTLPTPSLLLWGSCAKDLPLSDSSGAHSCQQLSWKGIAVRSPRWPITHEVQDWSKQTISRGTLGNLMRFLKMF